MTAVAAASRKSTEKKHNVVSPKAANPNMWSRKPKLRGQAMWSKAFENREANSQLKGFFLPPVSYCNLEIVVCQGLKNLFLLPKKWGAINKEKGF